MRGSVPIGVRLPAEVEERVARRARRLGLSRSRYVALIAEAAVADDEVEVTASDLEGVEFR